MCLAISYITVDVTAKRKNYIPAENGIAILPPEAD
jgi:hypothetical protein